MAIHLSSRDSWHVSFVRQVSGTGPTSDGELKNMAFSSNIQVIYFDSNSKNILLCYILVSII